MVDATHKLIPELSPVLADLSYNAPSVARFLSLGGGALASDGSNSYADNVKLNEHRLPQIALIDSQSFRQLNSRPPDDRGLTYLAPERLRPRASGLGALESRRTATTWAAASGTPTTAGRSAAVDLGAHRPERRCSAAPVAATPIPVQSGASPPCFVQPPSLFQNQQFPKLERGKVQVGGPPAGRAGTRPATP